MKLLIRDTHLIGTATDDYLGPEPTLLAPEWLDPDRLADYRTDGETLWRAPPESVSRFQARAALHQAGLLETVEALMADPATDPIARLAWADAQEFRRDSPTLATLAGALGLSDAQLDALFLAAAEITA